MTRQFFGTDGIRGVVGQDPITPDFFIRLGFAIGSILVKNNTDKKMKHPSVVIGKDTRVSGYMLESALEAGFIAAGVDVYLTGPMPTPATVVAGGGGGGSAASAGGGSAGSSSAVGGR